MPNSITLAEMRQFLSKSVASRSNNNKINGLFAEVDFRNHLASLGFEDRVSAGGWIVRSTGAGNFGRHNVAFFPAPLRDGGDLSREPSESQVPLGLHAVCGKLHDIGVKSYFACPFRSDGETEIEWKFLRLGLPLASPFVDLETVLGSTFVPRSRRHNFLRNAADLARLPDVHLPDEFAKEHLRVYVQSRFISEPSDIDGVFFGTSKTYPMEIKEKTVAEDPKVGPYFGLDVGPFAKLAFYATKSGNFHSLFAVKEIDNVTDRRLVGWWFIPFARLAEFASWVKAEGGAQMGGGRSAVVKIPKAAFYPMDYERLSVL